MPAELPERIRFLLAFRDLEIEVARLTAEQDELVAARGTEQSRTITFDSDEPDHHDPDRREQGRDGPRGRLAGSGAAPRDRDEAARRIR